MTQNGRKASGAPGLSYSESSPSRSGPKKYTKRAYGHACYACRERKIKCEDVQPPPCRSCRQTNTLCELVERNKPTKRLKPYHAQPKASDNHRPTEVAMTDKDISKVVAELLERVRRLEEDKRVRSSPNVDADDRGYASTSAGASVTGSDLRTETQDGELGRPGYNLGSASRPEYHGELSMFDDSGQRQSRLPSPLLEGTSPNSWTEEQLRAAARLRHRYTTASEGEAWMNAYFSWASPVYAVVNERLFIRDMALGGPYFSEFLLLIIYITGIRLTYGMDEREREAKGEQFVSMALGMLAEETMGPARLTTIQALIGLSGRQSAVGKANQAWMLTGMAISMMQDMGLHLPVAEDAAASRFTADDRDMRNRLFWSAYCWDKTMSLTLGREPRLLCRPGLNPDYLPQDADDLVDWQPHLPLGNVLPLGRPYPPTKLRKTIVLRHSSHLNIQLESILTNLYSPGSPNARSLAFIRSAVDRLDTWRRDLPPELVIEGPTLPACSPPANIVILNLLYHTIRILIFRPLITANKRPDLVSSALHHCRNAAASTHEILSLWGDTFGHLCHHYLFLYCCFVSAGVDILLIRSGNIPMREESSQRVIFSLDLLERASSQARGTQRGIASIRSQFEKATQGALPTREQPYQGDVAHLHSFSSADDMDPGVGDVLDPLLMPPMPPATELEWPGGEIWDHQTLLDFLSAAPLSTEDPFAFGDQAVSFRDAFSELHPM